MAQCASGLEQFSDPEASNQCGRLLSGLSAEILKITFKAHNKFDFFSLKDTSHIAHT